MQRIGDMLRDDNEPSLARIAGWFAPREERRRTHGKKENARVQPNVPRTILASNVKSFTSRG